jgi:hypothetical protein
MQQSVQRRGLHRRVAKTRSTAEFCASSLYSLRYFASLRLCGEKLRLPLPPILLFEGQPLNKPETLHQAPLTQMSR